MLVTHATIITPPGCTGGNPDPVGGTGGLSEPPVGAWWVVAVPRESDEARVPLEVSRGQAQLGPALSLPRPLTSWEMLSTDTPACPERLCLQAWSSRQGQPDPPASTLAWRGLCRLEVSIKAVCFPVCLCVLCGGITSWAGGPPGPATSTQPYSFLQQKHQHSCVPGGWQQIEFHVGTEQNSGLLSGTTIGHR